MLPDIASIFHEESGMSKKSIYRHVVLFKFKDGVSSSVVGEIESAFRELSEKIPSVKGFEWGKDCSIENLNNGFTHCFIVTFSDADGRDQYLPHPAHEAFCRKYLDQYLEKACVVDFVSNN
jgi:hypothetical protein